MPKSMGLRALILSAALLFSPITQACEMVFVDANEDEIESITVGADGTASFEIRFIQEHRQCELDDDDVHIDFKGVEQVSVSSWEKVKKGTFKNDLVVKLTADSGEVRIWRECDKKGLSENAIKIIK